MGAPTYDSKRAPLIDANELELREQQRLARFITPRRGSTGRVVFVLDEIDVDELNALYEHQR